MDKESRSPLGRQISTADKVKRICIYSTQIMSNDVFKNQKIAFNINFYILKELASLKRILSSSQE